MKSFLKRFTAIVLAVYLLVPVLAGAVSAKGSGDAVSCAGDAAKLIKDIPVIEVSGFSGETYKGLSTETADDDMQIWPPTSDTIMGAVKAYGFQLIVSLLLGRYESAAKYISAALVDILGDIACDTDGVPDPDTVSGSVKPVSTAETYGYGNHYTFRYDWRWDMHTLAGRLDEFINAVMAVNSVDKVNLVGMSMGNCVLMTYLYEYYYTSADYAQRNHINSVIFLAGAMNGVASCGDPMSGNMSFDSTSLVRYLGEFMLGNESLKAVYYLVEALYTLRMIDPIAEYAGFLTDNVVGLTLEDGFLTTMATIPGFFALMSPQEYARCKDFMFDTPAKRERFAGLLAKNDYYHDKVQANGINIISSLLDDGVNTAIFAEYGFQISPVTSDNGRMSDGTILTSAESFGATCSRIDGTLGDGYVQAKACTCGASHVSVDNQIDASTCAFPDITWFGKNMHHINDSRLLAELFDLIFYSDRQITVGDCTEYPQFLINVGNGDALVPLTAENCGEAVPFEQTTFAGRLAAKLSAFLRAPLNWLLKP